jgi:hypothetical protein
MRYNGTNISQVVVYGMFNLTPMVCHINATAETKYAMAVNWDDTIARIRHALTQEVAARCNISPDNVLIDVLTHTPAAQTRVLMPYDDATSAMTALINFDTVEHYIEFYPLWGMADYAYLCE